MAYRKMKKGLVRKYKSVKKKFANFVGKVTYKKLKNRKGRKIAKLSARKMARKIYRRN